MCSYGPVPRGGTITLLLVKNPTGLNEVVRTLVDSGVDLTATLFALNDGIADGRDTSWIWDADVEPLLERAGAMVVTGERAAEFGLRDSIEFNTEVTSIVWNEADRIYDITATGPEGKRSWRANAVISCIGFLNRPNMPEIEGADSFKGEIIHTSRWPKNPDFANKRWR